MDPRKRRTLDALLRAAGEIFRERPVEDVTVDEIAERAGVAVGPERPAGGGPAWRD